MKDEASEERNRMASACSSGVDTRPSACSGEARMTSSPTSICSSAAAASMDSVNTTPGWMLLTRTPCWASFRAQERVA